MARMNGEIDLVQDEDRVLDDEQVAEELHPAAQQQAQQEEDGEVIVDGEQPVLADVQEEELVPAGQQQAEAGDAVEEVVIPVIQQQVEVGDVAEEVVIPVIQQQAEAGDVVEEVVIPVIQQQAEAGDVVEEVVIPVIQQQAAHDDVTDVEEDVLPTNQAFFVESVEEVEESDVLNQARQQQAAADVVHVAETIVIEIEAVDIQSMHMPSMEPQQSSADEANATTEGHQESPTESFEARTSGDDAQQSTAPTPAPQIDAASAPSKSKKCTIYSFMMAMMAHPAAKIAGAILLSASLLALGLTVAGVMSFATSFIVMTALLGASMFAGHRYATKKPEPQEEPAPEAAATAGM